MDFRKVIEEFEQEWARKDGLGDLLRGSSGMDRVVYLLERLYTFEHLLSSAQRLALRKVIIETDIIPLERYETLFDKIHRARNSGAEGAWVRETAWESVQRFLSEHVPEDVLSPADLMMCCKP